MSKKVHNILLFTLVDLQVEKIPFSKVIDTTCPQLRWQVLVHDDSIKSLSSSSDKKLSVSEFIRIKLDELQPQDPQIQQHEQGNPPKQAEQKFHLLIHVFPKMAKSHQLIICQYATHKLQLMLLWFIWKELLEQPQPHGHAQAIATTTTETTSLLPHCYFPTYQVALPIELDWSILWYISQRDSTSFSNTLWRWIDYPEQSWIRYWKRPNLNSLITCSQTESMNDHCHYRWLKMLSVQTLSQAAIRWNCTVQELIVVALLGGLHNYFTTISPSCPTTLRFLLKVPEPFYQFIEQCRLENRTSIDDPSFLTSHLQSSASRKYVAVEFHSAITVPERIADLRCNLLEQIQHQAQRTAQQCTTIPDVTCVYQHYYTASSWKSLKQVKKVLNFSTKELNLHKNIPFICMSTVHGEFMSITLQFRNTLTVETVDLLFNLIQGQMNGLTCSSVNDYNQDSGNDYKHDSAPMVSPAASPETKTKEESKIVKTDH